MIFNAVFKDKLLSTTSLRKLTYRSVYFVVIIKCIPRNGKKYNTICSMNLFTVSY